MQTPNGPSLFVWSKILPNENTQTDKVVRTCPVFVGPDPKRGPNLDHECVWSDTNGRSRPLALLRWLAHKSVTVSASPLDAHARPARAAAVGPPRARHAVAARPALASSPQPWPRSAAPCSASPPPARSFAGELLRHVDRLCLPASPVELLHGRAAAPRRAASRTSCGGRARYSSGQRTARS